jgi:hypothetical protein
VAGSGLPNNIERYWQKFTGGKGPLLMEGAA